MTDRGKARVNTRQDTLAPSPGSLVVVKDPVANLAVKRPYHASRKVVNKLPVRELIVGKFNRLIPANRGGSLAV